MIGQALQEILVLRVVRADDPSAIIEGAGEIVMLKLHRAARPERHDLRLIVIGVHRFQIELRLAVAPADPDGRILPLFLYGTVQTSEFPGRKADHAPPRQRPPAGLQTAADTGIQT